MSTHNIPFFNMKKKKTLNYSKSAAMGFYSKGLKNEFERAVVNEPSVFEPLKLYCTCMNMATLRFAYPKMKKIVMTWKFCNLLMYCKMDDWWLDNFV